MKVNGAAFIAARKKIRAKCPGRGEAGRPALGTQEWLAEQANVSLRAVQYLEKGEASLKTIKAVSNFLGMQGWEHYIHNYGSEYVTCSAPKVIDFRPELYPPHNQNQFANSTLQMTIDPLSILIEEGMFDRLLLKDVKAVLTGLPVDIEFTWLAEVLLTPAGKGWLGWVREMREFYISADNVKIELPIMFRQLNPHQVTWGEFIGMIEASNVNQIYADISLFFPAFVKKIRVYLSIELMKHLFKEGRIKYKSHLPYRFHINTIT